MEIIKDNTLDVKDKTCVLYFTAQWCMPCKNFLPVLQQVEQECNLDIKKIDVDENSNVTKLFNIRNVPTLIFIKDGVEINRKLGSMKKTDLIESLKCIIQ